jgi:hypothetical protein
MGGSRRQSRGSGAAAIPLRELASTLRAVGALNGRPLNYSGLGRLLGVSSYKAHQRVLALERQGVLRLLPAFSCLCHPKLANNKRVCHRAILYLRDASGCAPFLHKPDVTVRSCVQQELQFRTSMIEQIIQREQARQPWSRFWYFGTTSSLYVPLLIATPAGRVGFQFSADSFPRRRRFSGLARAWRWNVIRRGFLLYPGSRAFFAARGVLAVPAHDFLGVYREWMEAAERTSSEGIGHRACQCNAWWEVRAMRPERFLAQSG